MARESRENRLRERAFILAEDFVRDYGRALPNDPHWKIAVEKTSGHIFRALVEVVRPSEAPTQGSEARPGVGTAVESNTADEKGLASRVEELERALLEIGDRLCDKSLCGHFTAEEIRGVCERALAGKKPADG